MGTLSTGHSANQLLELFGAEEKIRMDQTGHPSARMNRHYSDRQRAMIEYLIRELGSDLRFDYEPD